MLRCEAIRSAIEFGGTARVADSMATPSSGRYALDFHYLFLKGLNNFCCLVLS